MSSSSSASDRLFLSVETAIDVARKLHGHQQVFDDPFYSQAQDDFRADMAEGRDVLDAYRSITAAGLPGTFSLEGMRMEDVPRPRPGIAIANLGVTAARPKGWIKAMI